MREDVGKSNIPKYSSEVHYWRKKLNKLNINVETPEKVHVYLGTQELRLSFYFK